jgi:transposase
MIGQDQQKILRQAYSRGDTHAMAAKAAGVTEPTVGRWFRKYAEQGLERQKQERRFRRLPQYRGPAWIGKPASSR